MRKGGRMAEKWADYCITAVRHNEEHTHIEKVKVRPDNGEKLGDESIWTRSEVVSAIDNDGKTFVTVVKNKDATGAKVKMFAQ
jgi:hypothetical protein